ncbi:hypothetical protein PF007_g954 [Phytophthora fragariae]|uniref:Uncharacterized protein n=1 Tax=Phytophthora fragariae TaxID=53985 RepID=A0A6A3MLY6_9STRA|nr:hypothetical protein PF003_g13401 [Phytophthora fragariae]KAE9030380.1 hypothetical protein PF011_g635 [Phytophthora fragariae]KAE9139672.1 hypothetical protein PF007_g954 [Phytophthora fragariae]KAE9155131.1 hypothetical protein PF006_g893 [Phytophthora fragariae]
MPRKRSGEPLLSVDDALRDKPTRKAASEMRDEWLPKYELELGIKPGSKTSSGRVLDAICKFCLTYGREEDRFGTVQDASHFQAVLADQKRKETTRPAVFTAFRKVNIMKHIRQQHPSRWVEFDGLPLYEKTRSEYFGRDRKNIPFLPSQPAFSVLVPAGEYDPAVVFRRRSDAD